MLELNKYTKLNLACGPILENKFKSPWLNVDAAGSAADFICDVTDLPKEWTNHFSEVRASHVLEHLFIDDVPSAIAEWVRVLKPKGVLRIIVPDLDIIIKNLVDGFDSKKRDSFSVDKTTPVLSQIYGYGYWSKETEKEWRHRMIYNKEMLFKLLENQKGLSNIEVYKSTEDPAFEFGIDDDSQNIFSLHVKSDKLI